MTAPKDTSMTILCLPATCSASREARIDDLLRNERRRWIQIYAAGTGGGWRVCFGRHLGSHCKPHGLRPQGSIRLLINSFPKFHYLPKIAEPDVRSTTSGVPNAWSSFLLAKLETHWVQIKRRIGYSYFHGCYGVWILQAYLYQQPLTGSEL